MQPLRVRLHLNGGFIYFRLLRAGLRTCACVRHGAAGVWSRKDSAASPNFSTALTAGGAALRPGCCGGRASRCGRRTRSIFLLVPAAVRAFALLPFAVLLVGHLTRIGRPSASIWTCISGSCQRCLAFLWTPFLQWTFRWCVHGAFSDSFCVFVFLSNDKVRVFFFLPLFIFAAG